MKIKRVLSLLLALSMLLSLSAFASGEASGETVIDTLRVDSQTEPLAIENEAPVFSWKMTSAVTGQKQTAYQIVVTVEDTGEVVWDTGRVESAASVGIAYDGAELEPETAYTWSLTVWDKDGAALESASRFETGLMDPTLEAWDGAEFIGSTVPVLDAASAMIWHINTDMQLLEGDRVSIIFGADDFRLNDPFQNVENVGGENYIRLEFDFSEITENGGAVVNVYRVGYARGDTSDAPYKTVSGEGLDAIFNAGNFRDIHNVDISCETGSITVKVDDLSIQGAGGSSEGPGGPPGMGGGGLSVSPMSTGNNFNTFPNLNSVGFAADEGTEAVFTNYRLLDVGQSEKGVRGHRRDLRDLRGYRGL